MPRITRIHFAGLGHHDARIPALTLDMRDRDGRPADTIIWAENGTGKSSLLNLIFSTYRPNQRQFLGKQAEGRARELPDYVRERDLGFVVTEWDITDDEVQPSLLGEAGRDLLLVGQVLSWRGLDKSNDLRRLFFTLRPNHVIQLDALPILGLAQPVPSFEAFRDWLDERNRALPNLEIRYTTNQSEWQDHLANNRLDPELFTYQLRMNESEGGINNLFNSLRNDRDFIRLFLQLGFDSVSANQVRDNLQQFLPKLRNRSALELQLEFNEKVLQELNLFITQSAAWESTHARAGQAERQSAGLLAAIQVAAERFSNEAKSLSDQWEQLKGEETRLTSQRAAVTRKQNYFRSLKCRLEEEEARAEFQTCQDQCGTAEKQKRVLEMAIALAELARIKVQADQLRIAIQREGEQAKPFLKTLRELGGRLKCRLDEEAASIASLISAIDEEYRQLREGISSFRDTEASLAAERSEKLAKLTAVEEFFAERDSERERLRHEEWVDSKETAAFALQSWYEVRASAVQARTDAEKSRDAALREKDELSSKSEAVVRQIATTENERTQFDHLVHQGEAEEERIATHQQMRAALETTRADLSLPQTGERLVQLAESLFRRILRINVEGAEDQRTKEYFDKYRLFPPHRDVEITAEKLNSAGVGSATTSMNWLAYNVADPQKATELLAHDPSTFSGVMFDDQSEAERASEILAGISTEQIPVTVSALPLVSDVDQHSGREITEGNTRSAPVTLLPGHAGSFNFEAARTGAQRLETQQTSRAQELDTLKGDLAATRTLVDNFHTWFASYGGAKIHILRERLRGSGQALEQLQERQRSFLGRKEELERAIGDSTARVAKALELKNSSEIAIGQLEPFIKKYDAPYESNSTRRQELTARLQSIEVEQLSTGDLRRSKESQEPTFRDRSVALQVQRSKLEDEILKIRYASSFEGNLDEPVDELRSSYEYQVKQYEGTFLNSKASGELSAAEQRMIEMEKRIAREFRGVDSAAANSMAAERGLEDRVQSASTALMTAHQEQGKAEQKLRVARDRLRELSGISEQDRVAQAEIIPRTSVGAAEELGKLENQYAELHANLEQNRTQSDQVKTARADADRRSSNFNNHAQRLSDLLIPDPTETIELPSEDSRTAELVNERISDLQRLRKERDKEHDKLQGRYSAIQELTQEDRYAKATDLPARSLFAHMPVEELTSCAGNKRGAIDEEIKTIRADLDLMAQHRETLVTSLLNVSKQAIRLLRRAERWSTMPADLTGWESEPFLRIRLFEPQGELECRSRLKWLVDSILEDGRIPAGVELVFLAIMALVGETGIDATILKPETQRRKVRYPVREMAGWSEGERTTVAILLYCTLVKIRSQSRGTDAGQNQVSALLLDNPLGPCSKPEFLQMHRQIAGQLGVQLIYATGINDPPALSVFPNWIRLAKNRIVPETGELAVGLIGQHEDSMLSGIRIFEDQPKVHA